MTERKVRFGVHLPTRKVVSSSQGDRIKLHTLTQREILGMADAAEEAGYDILSLGDSILAKPRLEVITTLAAAAARTRHIQLLTAVLIPVLRPPILLADQLATVDHIASGRLMLGIGVGEPTDIVRKEFRDLNLEFKKRGKQSDELLRLLKKLWTESNVTHHGEFYHYDNVNVEPKPFQQPHPPLYIAAGHYNFSDGKVEGPFRRVAELGDGWISALITPDERKEAWRQIVGETQKLGRDPLQIDRVCFISINIRPSREQAIEEMRDFLSGYLGESFEQFFNRAADLHRWGAFGTLADCLEIIRAYIDSGADAIVMRLPRDDQLAQLHEVAEQVLPHFRGVSVVRL